MGLVFCWVRMKMDRIRIEMDSDISDIYFFVSYYSLRPKILHPKNSKTN